MHSLTIAYHEAQQQRQQQRVARRDDRYHAFCEFKSSYHDLLDSSDWAYYCAATGLRLTTLVRFVRPAPSVPLRVFARPPRGVSFEPLDVRSGRLAEADFLATRASAGLLRHLAAQNPDWTFRAATSFSSANCLPCN